MILYYAIGGGLGHVARARRVLEALGMRGAIATSADDAKLVAGDFPVIQIPRELESEPALHRRWLRAVMRGCHRLIADTFPCGIQGELAGLDSPVDYVARLLRFDEYTRAVQAPPPRFETSYVVEELTPAHAAFVEANSARVMSLDLRPEPSQGESSDYWLIVHSGPREEVEELIAYAEELRRIEDSSGRVLVATATTPTLPADYERVDAFPATPLYAGARKIISAAGFNVMLETSPWREKHHVLPFPRRFDDQFARAARSKIAR